jgi:hypothetical protein
VRGHVPRDDRRYLDVRLLPHIVRRICHRGGQLVRNDLLYLVAGKPLSDKVGTDGRGRSGLAITT